MTPIQHLDLFSDCACCIFHDSPILTEQMSLGGRHDAVAHIDRFSVRHSRNLRPDRPSAGNLMMASSPSVVMRT
jgi:hypothetical protein